jgi:hypothetical protein
MTSGLMSDGLMPERGGGDASLVRYLRGLELAANLSAWGCMVV